ncbi:hypothetical protein SAMN05216466_113185 [Paraburkholderia phenazinium]|uniref:Uncharacterized protein n=1 Tax=Paraburkholderia phenazinium TaxID=60549 RepID=A0A1G8FH52_9BURK|nr:hypothetical protein SAMN05216466_113185 [Paraburkholderia phenazinium]
MSHQCKDGRQRLGAGTGFGSTKPSKAPARRAFRHGGCTTAKHADRMPDKASVYPQHGPFLNPLAFSNIERYRLTHRWSGKTPRSFLLRSSPGTSLTMQPISKPAQSMYTKSLWSGTRARSTR